MDDVFLDVRRSHGVERVGLVGAQMTLGRATENAVCFSDDNAVSRRHAVLTRLADGWTIRDTGSANGTFVNGERLTAERRLKPGDRVTVGSSGFVFRSEENTPRPPPPPPPAPSPRATPPPPAAPVSRTAPVPTQGHGHVVGVARGVQTRRNAGGEEQLVFQVDRDDGRPPISVRLNHRDASIEGEEVEITGMWENGILQARSLLNLRTGSEVTIIPKWQYRTLAGLAILLVLLLLLVFWLLLGF